MVTYNREIEVLNNDKRSWVLAYADGSEYYIPGALHVERNDALMKVKDDEAAARAAKRAGVPLITDIKGVPKNVYVDTLENRQIIARMLQLYPEYIRNK